MTHEHIYITSDPFTARAKLEQIQATAIRWIYTRDCYTHNYIITYYDEKETTENGLDTQGVLLQGF